MMIDLSHEIEAGMITYRGLPAPVITDFMSREASRKNYAEGTEFSIAKIEMVANTGTYLDSPFHRFENGVDLSGLPLESLANLPGIVIHSLGREGQPIGVESIRDRQLHGCAVLFHTGWAQHWRTETYFSGHPFLTKELCELLVEKRVKLVGIDSYNIDSTSDLTRPAHTILLRAEIPIVEHLCNLENLPDDGFRFFAVPPRVKQFGTFPVRSFALL